VIAAILLERNLQSVANYLILSLAVADLLVAVLVMPLGAVYEVKQLIFSKDFHLDFSSKIINLVKANVSTGKKDFIILARQDQRSL